MKKNMSMLSMILLTIIAIAIIAQMTLEQAAYSNFGLAAVIILIFVFTYLIAKLYERFK